MKKIILDSCSAILLAKASVLESLTKTHNLSLTKPVYEEVIAGKEKMFADALLVERLKKENKITLVTFDKELMDKLVADFNMGEGEASSIAVCLKDKSLMLATDNLQGRKAANINSILLVGSIEMIVSLFKNDKIDKPKAIEALKILRKEGWFDTNLLDKAMEDIK